MAFGYGERGPLTFVAIGNLFFFFVFPWPFRLAASANLDAVILSTALLGLKDLKTWWSCVVYGGSELLFKIK